jgi:23S rRNA (uracil1939-C5)-methyltransferase
VKKDRIERVQLDKIVAGGQALGHLENGKKIFVWGGLPDETVTVRLTKSKSNYVEGIVTDIHVASDDRMEPRDPDSYLSTSPWQIMTYESELQHKAQLVQDAFTLHNITLSGRPTIFSDGRELQYRNKVEFSWWWDNDNSQLDLAFFRRGGHGKLPVSGTSLARPEINDLAVAMRNLLRKKNLEARLLKTLLIRCDQDGRCVWQLYCKDRLPDILNQDEVRDLPAMGGEVIYSDPKSPASRITERLASFGDIKLEDTVHGQPYRYAAESFFQINLPVYEQSLGDIDSYLEKKPVLDLYSGVGSIGLSVADSDVTLVEIDAHAYAELQQNIALQNKESIAQAVLSPSEKALDYISGSQTVIVDPPRAGLHTAVVNRLLEKKPPRIIYLSCNPVTQARDVALLQSGYEIRNHKGYNFFPRTPHIEYLVVLDKRD